MARMPFGLNNAISMFQGTMEIVLQGLQWETCLVYIYDIIVYGSSFTQHLQQLEQVLDRIQKAGLKLKPEKCHLFKTEVVFLGHMVSSAKPSKHFENHRMVACSKRQTGEAVCSHWVILPPLCQGLCNR